MTRRREYWLKRIRAAGLEAEVVEAALGLVADLFAKDPTHPAVRELGLPEIRAAILNREATYTIRMFAECEQGLREAWAAKGLTTVPPVRDLVEGWAARGTVPDSVREELHRVREYRNAVVHGGETADALSLADARRALCRFFAHLPPAW